MNIDEKIKAELEQEAQQLDAILPHNEGIFTMLAHAYKGALGWLMVIITIVALALFIIMLWSGYHFFFTKISVAEQLYWGLILVVSSMMQIAVKMWTFMEVNRQSTLREIKRLELSIEKLSQQLSKS